MKCFVILRDTTKKTTYVRNRIPCCGSRVGARIGLESSREASTPLVRHTTTLFESVEDDRVLTCESSPTTSPCSRRSAKAQRVPVFECEYLSDMIQTNTTTYHSTYSPLSQCRYAVCESTAHVIENLCVHRTLRKFGNDRVGVT